MSSRATRACDGCRVRKVKCNCAQPCSQCAHLDLNCVYSPVTKRKPSVRNRLVAQLRNNSIRSDGGGSSGSSTTGTGGGVNINININTTTNTGSSNDSSSGGGGSGGVTNDSNDSNDSNNSDLQAIAAWAASSLSHNDADSSPPAVTSIAGIVNSDHGDSPPVGLSPVPACSSGSSTVYNPDFFISLLPKYEKQVYPVNPIITSSELHAAIANMHADLEDAAFVYACAAVTINLTTPMSWALHGETGMQMRDLMQHSLRAYRCAESTVDLESSRLSPMPITFKRIMTCIFLEIIMMTLKNCERSFSMLREAMTMIQIIHAEQYSHSAAPLDPGDVPRFQRLYWEAFIHERCFTTFTGFPCIFTPLPTGLPVSDTTIPPHVDVGFNRLVHLFQIMDGPFLYYWNAQQNPSQPVPGVSPQWIESKLAELDEDEAGTAKAEETLAASGRGRFTEFQHADLFVTRLWLRTLLWQFGLTHGFLRSMPPENTHEGLSIHFPAVRLSVQLRSLVSRVQSMASITTHGTGILNKLLEITSTVADVLALPLGYGQTQDDVRMQIEDFNYLVHFLFRFKRAEKGQWDYLREKLEALQQQYTMTDFMNVAGLGSNPITPQG